MEKDLQITLKFSFELLKIRTFLEKISNQEEEYPVCPPGSTNQILCFDSKKSDFLLSYAKDLNSVSPHMLPISNLIINRTLNMSFTRGDGENRWEGEAVCGCFGDV